MTTPTPDRRLAPQPLPAQLASAMTLWLTSRAALPLSKRAFPGSSAAAARLRTFARELDAAPPEAVAAALDRAILERAERCLAGLEAYRRHPFRRAAALPPILWCQGTTRLLDYGAAGDPAVLVVPSLINRYYVLDLLPERSFLRQLAKSGLRPLVVDWDAPGPTECGFGLADYITRLDAAFDAVRAAAGAPIAILGYCMGGLLALALGLRRRRDLAGLVLLATPWDFHAAGEAQARRLGLLASRLAGWYGAAGAVSVDFLQGLFMMLDPFGAERKFVRFAGVTADSAAARDFVALEDWLNDGVPLALPTAIECLRDWYGENAPGRGAWRVAGDAVRPAEFDRPALVIVPAADRIVPPAAAEPLAAALGEAAVLRPALGHIGMMAAERAPALLWAPLVEWLCARLAGGGAAGRRLDRRRRALLECPEAIPRGDPR